MSTAAALSQLYALKMLPIPESEETKLELDELGRAISKHSHRSDEEKSPSIQNYFDDPNLDLDVDSDFAFEDESPYPEVRCAVSNTDDPLMPVSTLRAWVLGLTWSLIVPGINQFFFFRYPSVEVTGIVAQLITYPIGRAAAAYLPCWNFFGLELNPGPFTIKEHVLITATVGQTSAYGTDIIAVQRVFYSQNYSFLYQWFLTISTQLIGFSIGGISRHILVEPPSMIWPTNLVTCALFNTLHSEHYAGMGNRGGLSRERYFWFAFTASFVWYFFPGYLFQALSYFSWVTWIWPQSPTVAQLFGYVNGLGFSVLTFDWSQIAYIGSPLATPWWAQANVISGFLLFIYVWMGQCKLIAEMQFKNVWYGLHMPILSRSAYDNTMQTYDVLRILNPDSTFNATKYDEYSPLYLSFGSYLFRFTATLSHSFLFFRKQIWVHARRSISEQRDIHSRLMSQYPQVPEWWYLVIFIVSFLLGVLSIELWPTQMPVWAFFLALIIAFTYVIPVGMIQAITNQQVALKYALPGRPIATMMFKTWGYNSMSQALTFTSDLKLAHYMKIPPRPMFFAQVICSMCAATAQLGVQTWLFDHVSDICQSGQLDRFTCQNTEVFGVASIIASAIGPNRMFSQGIRVLLALLFFFLIGALAPIISWLIDKKYPNSFFKYVNPVIFNGTQLLPPATGINYVPWAIVGFIFQYLIRRRNFPWWTKYNYVLSAALDSGLAISVIIIYFALQYPRNGTIGKNTILSWWGNTVSFTGADGRGVPVIQLPVGEVFGSVKFLFVLQSS
ncbi:OPT oligopeptide transporter [Lentinula edodes]|uniref:OPT oligopeptide transporter n=1 Tax=Lentinula edodes TaxID=5353 RepID=UPI001E8CDA7E|nr:OPT oligopeptide transporter [Lentinula edodes]KAH7881628.1 OPT oligopeptide transporter [Lentinula edodes]